MSLGATAARGAAIMFSGQLLRVVVQTVSVVVLARLLSPSDFGLIAMVAAVIGVAAVLRDFGLGQAAVQARVITDHQRSNLFWINVVIGLGIAVIVFAAGTGVASVYGTPDLAPVVQALAVTFLLGGAATQFRAELSRELRFGALAITEASAQAVGVVVAIAAALGGFGYWSLVFQQIADASILLVISAVLSRWRPGLPSRQPMAEFYRFGWGLLGTQLVLYASQNLDIFLIGTRYGSAAAGSYNRAFQLLMLPLNQISAPATKVALPVLSRIQGERERFDSYVLRANLLVGLVVILGLSLLASQADAVVGIVLGPQWADAAEIFRVLAVAGCFQALSYASYWVFLAHGQTRSNLLFSLLTRGVVAGAMVIAVHFSVIAVAAVYACGLALSWPLSLLWIRRWGPSARLFGQGARMLAYGVLLGLASWSTTFLPMRAADIVDLLIGCGAALLVGMSMLLLPVVRRDFLGVIHAARMLRRRKS